MADPAEERYRALLERPGLTLGEVQEACFRGIPDRLRAPFWKLLLGAMPLEVAARDVALAVSRQRYREFLAEVTTNPCADDDGCDGDGSGGGGGGGGRRRHRARGSEGDDGGDGDDGSRRASSGSAAAAAAVAAAAAAVATVSLRTSAAFGGTPPAVEADGGGGDDASTLTKYSALLGGDDGVPAAGAVPAPPVPPPTTPPRAAPTADDAPTTGGRRGSSTAGGGDGEALNLFGRKALSGGALSNLLGGGGGDGGSSSSGGLVFGGGGGRSARKARALFGDDDDGDAGVVASSSSGAPAMTASPARPAPPSPAAATTAVGATGGAGLLPLTGVVDDPLSVVVGDKGKWAEWHKDEELRVEIDKDIQRTLPGLQFFTVERHMAAMARILFVFAKLNIGVRYVQGMNELLAPLWYVIATDEAMDGDLEAAEADTFACFQGLMAEVRDVFIKAHDDSATGVGGTLARYGAMLRSREPAVAARLAALHLDHQFYAFRWITTLLSREFEMPAVLVLWDSLFADPERFAFLLHTCVAMVRLQRTVLTGADFGTAMKLLQHYPPVDIPLLLTTADEVRSELAAAAGAPARQASGTRRSSGALASGASSGAPAGATAPSHHHTHTHAIVSSLTSLPAVRMLRYGGGGGGGGSGRAGHSPSHSPVGSEVAGSGGVVAALTANWLGGGGGGSGGARRSGSATGVSDLGYEVAEDSPVPLGLLHGRGASSPALMGIPLKATGHAPVVRQFSMHPTTSMRITSSGSGSGGEGAAGGEAAADGAAGAPTAAQVPHGSTTSAAMRSLLKDAGAGVLPPVAPVFPFLPPAPPVVGYAPGFGSVSTAVGHGSGLWDAEEEPPAASPPAAQPSSPPVGLPLEAAPASVTTAPAGGTPPGSGSRPPAAISALDAVLEEDDPLGAL